MRVTLPTGEGGGSLFCCFRSLIVCLKAQLAEAQVVCVEHPILVGDFNADLEVIPCLAKGIASGRLVDLLLLALWALVRSRMLFAG